MAITIITARLWRCSLSLCIPWGTWSFTATKDYRTNHTPKKRRYQYWTSLPSSIKKESRRLLKMWDKNVLNNKKDIWLLGVYALATSVKLKHCKRHITVHEFLQKPGKDFYCRQTSSKVGLPDINVRRWTLMAFWLLQYLFKSITESRSFVCATTYALYFALPKIGRHRGERRI